MPSTTRTKRLAPARAKAAAGPRGDFAYDAMLRAIADGTFKPGERLREVAISQWLGISRTPVREGLRRLEADGLLAHTPHAGMLVTPVDRRMVAELYDMREVLEGTAARLAAENATRTDIDALNALVAQESRLPVDPDAASRHNRAFHETLYQSAHNRYLLKSLRALADALLLLGPTTLHSARRQQFRACGALRHRRADRPARCRRRRRPRPRAHQCRLPGAPEAPLPGRPPPRALADGRARRPGRRPR